MSAVYDNWERLVRATIRREDLRLSALRTPSDLSLASSSPSLSASSSFNFIRPSNQVSSFNFSNLSVVGNSFSYQQIRKATNYFSSSNLIKDGRFGNFFNGVFEGGTQVAVEKFDLTSEEQVLLFFSELEFYAKGSHPNFVPLLGHYFEDFSHGYGCLVYKHMPNKDLSTSFFKIVDFVDGPVTSLDWKTRFKAATGVAEALYYLHHQCVPPLVHGNVASGNILLDENYNAHLWRPYKICPERKFEVYAERKDRNESMISRLLRRKGSEQRTSAGTSNASRAYDVYCFGKVLLELITGYPFSTYHENAIKTTPMEDILGYISIYNKDFAKIMDRFLVKDERLLDEAWTVSVVAKSCLNANPVERPTMVLVRKRLVSCTRSSPDKDKNP